MLRTNALFLRFVDIEAVTLLHLLGIGVCITLWLTIGIDVFHLFNNLSDSLAQLGTKDFVKSCLFYIAIIVKRDNIWEWLWLVDRTITYLKTFTNRFHRFWLLRLGEHVSVYGFFIGLFLPWLLRKVTRNHDAIIDNVCEGEDNSEYCEWTHII